MAKVDPKLMALAYLEGARHDLKIAAEHLDDVTTRTCHQHTIEAMVKVDETQTLTAAIISGEEPEFESSIPNRCPYHLADLLSDGVQIGASLSGNPQCFKEEGHDGDHEWEPPPSA